MIYFILAKQVSKLKIGYTTNINNRFSEIQTGSPVELHLIGTIDGNQEFEKYLHKRLKGYHSHGEWFHWVDGIKKELRKELKTDIGFFSKFECTLRKKPKDFRKSICADCDQEFRPGVKGSTNLLCNKCYFMSCQDKKIRSKYENNKHHFNQLLTSYKLRKEFNNFKSNNGGNL